jgi:hypothetical protein
LKGIDDFKDIRVDWRTVLKWILEGVNWISLAEHRDMRRAVMNWIGLAEHRDMRRAVMNWISLAEHRDIRRAVMNIGFIKCRECLPKPRNC